MAAGDGGKKREEASEPTRAQRAGARLSRFIEWSTRRAALADAREAEKLHHEERAALAHARDAVRAGDRLLDPPDGTARQPDLAMCLFREAASWSLRGLAPEQLGDLALAAQLARARELSDSEASRWLATRAPPSGLETSAVEYSDLSLEARVEIARASQRWLHALLVFLSAQHEAVTRLRLERLARVGATTVAVATLAVLLALAILRLYRGPDLAENKPWRASSTHAVCDPEMGSCGGAKTRILFHTGEDERPWFEIDLLKPTQVQRVEVENRRDDGQDRAVPLVLEMSLDGKSYWQVAQISRPFTTWNVDFTKQLARYVRLTVPRRSILHLERVSVRP